MSGTTHTGWNPQRKETWRNQRLARDLLQRAPMNFAALSIDSTSEWGNEEVCPDDAAFQQTRRDASLRHALDGFLVHSQQGRVLEASERLSGLTGYTPDELLERSVFELCDADPRLLVGAIESSQAEGRARLETNLFRRNGSTVPVELNLHRGEYEGEVFHSVFVRDLTGARAAQVEEAELQARLARSERMESLGVLAGGVAHDLNNILGPLVGYPELLEEDLPADSPCLEMIREMGTSAHRAAAVIQDLLALTRRGNYRKEPLSLNDLVHTYLQSPECRRTMGLHPAIHLDTELDPFPLPILGSAPHLQQVLMNLVNNAFEAIEGEGAVTIQTRCRHLDLPVGGYDEIEEGDYVILTVSDTGAGIPPESVQRIFEPFYTKKMMGRSGTGLGLSVVYGVVKDLSGYIDVQSDVGRGTTFALYFPVTRQSSDTPLPSVPSFRGGERILVVDDVREQRNLATRLLSSLGYEVSSVPSGESCIDFLRQKSVDLLVLDMIMKGGMDGLETLKRVRDIRPTQRCIIASGFAETDRVKSAMALGAGEYVLKPYTLDKIGQAVRTELDRLVVSSAG